MRERDAAEDAATESAREDAPARAPRTLASMPRPGRLGPLALLGVAFHSLPVRLRHDVAYLWATFRLRQRPLKMLLLLCILGGLCWVWQWAGYKWGQKWLDGYVGMLNPGAVQSVLRKTASALFSSLNFLSCVTIVIIARSLRRLAREGHLEALMMTPRLFRPSALFYALTTRYIPLAFVAILVIYVDPVQSPFNRFPFVAAQIPPPPPAPTVPATTPAGREAMRRYGLALRRHDQQSARYDEIYADPGVILWPACYELSIYLFCTTNLFLDLSISFWIFSRRRISLPTTVVAVVVVGLLSPILLMTINERVFTAAAESPSMQWLRDSVSRPFLSLAAASIHYTICSLVSVAAGWLLLFDLDRRWLRDLRDMRRDPVLLRTMD